MSEENLNHYNNSNCAIPSSNIFEVNSSSFLEHLDVTTRSLFKDDFMGVAAACSVDRNIETGLLNDIVQVSSKVPIVGSSSPKQKHGVSSKCTSMELQTKETGVGKGNLEPKPTHTLPYNKSPDHLLTKKRNREQRRRAEISSKLRAIEALIPSCSKRDHASILDNAIKHIKSLKVHLEMLNNTARLMVQSEHQASYSALCAPMIFQGSGSTLWPPQLLMFTPPSYPLMIPPPNLSNFPVQLASHIPVNPILDAQTTYPLLSPTNIPTNTQPSI